MTATHHPALHAQNRPWNAADYSPQGNGIWKVPTMLTKEERRMLSYLTEHEYKGEGAIVDLGCFLGGSSAFLAHGLSQNVKQPSVKVESFDLFKLSKYERESFFPRHDLTVPDDDDSFGMFTENVKPLASWINPNRGNILDYQWQGGPIEILFIDLMKSSKLYDHVIETFLPHLIPNCSIMILQDYMFGGSGAWHMNLVEKLSNKLSFYGQTEINSVLYTCRESISSEEIEPCKWAQIPQHERILNLAKNAARWQYPQHQQFVLKILENMLSDQRCSNSGDKMGENYNQMLRAS